MKLEVPNKFVFRKMKHSFSLEGLAQLVAFSEMVESREFDTDPCLNLSLFALHASALILRMHIFKAARDIAHVRADLR